MSEPPAKRFRGPEPEFVSLLDEDEDEVLHDGKDNTLQAWLEGLGLEHLQELFTAAEITDLSLVEHLTLDDLIELGIDDENERQLILTHAKSRGHIIPAIPPPPQPEGASSKDMFRQPCNHHRGKITSFFPPLHRDRTESLPDMRPIGVRFNPSLTSAGPPSAASASTSSSHSNASLLARAQSAPLPKDTSLPKNIPRWRRLPGTRMTVDCFSEMSKELKGISYWVLSHFHSDHYRGLTRKFCQGVIVCSTVTGRLIEQRLKIPPSIVLTLPFNTPTVIEGSTIELIDANHCPGAAMILCETPNVAFPVLHCGDCRLVKEHQNHPSLIRTRGKAMLILDTTYCDPQYTFPPQEETIEFVYNEV
jgi:DNA cross-link repair 1A protein